VVHFSIDKYDWHHLPANMTRCHHRLRENRLSRQNCLRSVASLPSTQPLRMVV